MRRCVLAISTLVILALDARAEDRLAGLEAEDSGGKGEQSVVLFVDDSVAELVDPRLTADPRVHRVLFVRALL